MASGRSKSSITIYLLIGASCADDAWPDDVAFDDLEEAEKACQALNEIGYHRWEVVAISLNRKGGSRNG